MQDSATSFGNPFQFVDVLSFVKFEHAFYKFCSDALGGVSH